MRRNVAHAQRSVHNGDALAAHMHDADNTT